MTIAPQQGAKVQQEQTERTEGLFSSPFPLLSPVRVFIWLRLPFRCMRLQRSRVAAVVRRLNISHPSLLPLFPRVQILLLLLLFPLCVQAEVAPVAVRVPESKAWIGQRVPFFVELRAPGSFVGTATFDLPQIPGALVMKIGNPVVGSQEIEGASRFVQTHEFALFSQKPGVLELPAFPVRFSRREGFTGPATDVQANVPAARIEIQRPPGSEDIGFLITTESLEVTETWEPQPGPARVGAMFKRTIVQRAPNLPGMALAPAPSTAPEGIRVYPGEPATNDKLERGDFLGERRETITYLLQKPGTLALPAITYVWWNPKTETLQSKTLPAATFEVAPPSSTATTGTATAPRRVWPWLLAVTSVIALMMWQRQRLASWGRRIEAALNPPDRVATRGLLRACRRHDATAAHAAWVAWCNVQSAAFQPGSELRSAVVGLQRMLFGPESADAWQGDELARAFRRNSAVAKARSDAKPASALPALNPQA